jgi:hypothetical protein
MKLCVLTTSLLLTTTLLLGTVGCHKKDDPILTPVGTGSYTLDGRAVSCQATASAATTSRIYSTICITLTTTPAPASGAEVLYLYFHKPLAQPTAAYQPTEIFYTPTPSSLVTPPGFASLYRYDTGVLTETSTGVFSGTFAIQVPGYPIGVFTQGVFTNARL